MNNLITKLRYILLVGLLTLTKGPGFTQSIPSDIEQHPGFYLNHPDQLVTNWSLEAIPIDHYDSEAKQLQLALNQQEDLIISQCPAHQGSLTRLPIHSAVDQIEITPFTWKWVHLSIASAEEIIRVKLRRPNSWLVGHNLTEIGKTSYLDLEVLGIQGRAVVTGIFPNLFDSRFSNEVNEKGQRELPVIGFVQHISDSVFTFSFSDNQTIQSTPKHPLWSLNRLQWVPIATLDEGESMASSAGSIIRFSKVVRGPTTQQVFNIEVYKDHTYYVGQSGLLAHNVCILQALPIEEVSALKKTKIWKHFVSKSGKSLPLNEALKLLDKPTSAAFIKEIKGAEHLASQFAKNPKLVEVWSFLYKEGDEAALLIRNDPKRLAKLNDYISKQGANINKLKSSFKNTDFPDKWVDLKIPQKELDKIAKRKDVRLNDHFDAWTPEHKAKRWANYSEGRSDADIKFESWSNTYDGNINKAAKGNQKVKEYANMKKLKIPEDGYEVTWPKQITIDLRGKKVTGKRRHDIYFEENEFKKAIEVKDYKSGKVYKSEDIEREALMDIQLLEKGLVDEVEWVFLGEGPSEPLRKLLKDNNIKIWPDNGS